MMMIHGRFIFKLKKKLFVCLFFDLFDLNFFYNMLLYLYITGEKDKQKIKHQSNKITDKKKYEDRER